METTVSIKKGLLQINKCTKITSWSVRGIKSFDKQTDVIALLENKVKEGRFLTLFYKPDIVDAFV